nr:HupE/UreJ family protein [uncultured Glaciecola sp.]
MIIRNVIFILTLLFANNLLAHELSTTFVAAELSDDGSLNGQVKLDVLDLKEVLTLDINANGELTWGEIEASTEIIQNYISNGLRFFADKEQCMLNVNNQLELQELTGVTYLVLPFSSQCPQMSQLSFEYSLLFDAAANHKAIFSLRVESEQHVFIVDDQNVRNSIDVSVNKSSSWATFGAFIYQGIFHILIGLDHILFLLTLLLTICLYRQVNEWKDIESKKVIIRKTLVIITSFTIAHSITLSGTALGIIPVMGSWIEVVIAASILFNVINNLFPMIKNLGLITFIFGLIHGMGFAGALSEFGFTKEHQLLSVLGFNLGVEIGQLGLLVVLLPILLWLRKSNYYKWYGMQLFSLLVGGLAIYWILERW